MWFYFKDLARELEERGSGEKVEEQILPDGGKQKALHKLHQNNKDKDLAKQESRKSSTSSSKKSSLGDHKKFIEKESSVKGNIAS